MRQSLDLKYFGSGLYSNADQKDIPDEAQTEGSYNLDVETNGVLKGIPGVITQTTLSTSGVRFGWIERNTGEWDLVYSTGSRTSIVYDFYGTPTHADLSGMSAIGAEEIITNNQEVHIGSGRDNPSAWAGYISHGQFGGSAPSSLQVTEAEPKQPTGSDSVTVQSVSTTATEEDAVFIKGVAYQYKISLVYDGYQESPLGGVGDTQKLEDFVTFINLRVLLANYSSLNKRITGVKVYRRERPMYNASDWTNLGEYLQFVGWSPNLNSISFAEVSTQRAEAKPTASWGEYFLVEDIDINDTGWTTSGSDKYIDFTDDNVVGASYYNNVGIDEDSYYTTTEYSLDFSIGASVANYLFVGDAKHLRIPDEDAAHMIFRSKPYRFDTFDWVNDRLVLPTRPKAMKSHRGKLYVWDENNTYIINPTTLGIEKKIMGRGCISQQSVVETDYGLFWANKNGVYWSTQTEELLKPTKDNLSEQIKAQYQDAVGSETPLLTYNSARNQVLIHLGSNVFAYNVVERRWDYYPTFLSGATGAFVGKDGETYTTSSSGIFKDFGSVIRKVWMFISKEFKFGSSGQDKKFYKLIRESGGATTVSYSLDGGDTWTSASEDIGVQRGKSLMLKILGQSQGASLDFISIVFRKLKGER